MFSFLLPNILLNRIGIDKNEKKQHNDESWDNHAECIGSNIRVSI